MSSTEQSYKLLNSLYIRYQPFNDDLVDGLEPSLPSEESTIFENEKRRKSDEIDAFELVNWAIPKFQSVMDEGIAVYEYVYDNIIIEPVEPLPSFKCKGYFLVPDLEKSYLRIMEYASLVYPLKKKPASSLKTKSILRLSFDNINSSTIEEGIRLVDRYIERINPAIYYCNTQIDFPFRETVLPIAKSKLLSKLNEE